MYNTPKASRMKSVDRDTPSKESRTSQARSDSHLALPLISPIPRYRLSPALDEFSLRRTPSRGATTSPAPAKGVRKRLHRYRTFDHAASLIKQSKNIVILTGAGISTSVGIPDFRSDKGLYSQLSKDLGITEAEEFFSKDYFIHNTQQFFQYVKRVIPEAVIGADGFFKATNSVSAAKDGRAPVPRFSLTHAFLALLEGKKKLLTNYTQNIDGLETAAGVSRAKFIQCHGSWDTASCMTCGRSSTAKKYLPVVLAGNIPYCKCKLEEHKSKKRAKKKAGRKRTWDEFDSDHSSDDGTKAPRGLMKPDITFFNERLSGSYDERLNEDKRRIDLLIIIGTSLKVGPVQDMLYQIAPKVPQIFISKERFSGALCNLPGVQVDIELLGECDVIIEELCRRAGWLAELNSLCWRPGQLKIKTFEAQPDTKMRHSDEQTGPMAVRENERKLLQPSSSQFASDVVNPSQPGGSSSCVTKTTTDLEDFEGESDLKRTYTVTETVKHARNGDPLEGELLSGSQSSVSSSPLRNKLGTDSRPSDVFQRSDSLVKIELVEGTTHQWRVTKRC